GRAPGLSPVRLAIDGVDDGLVLLLAARARLARVAGRIKARAGVRGRDSVREQRVRERAEALASALGLAPGTASGVLELAIGEACRAQGLGSDRDQGAAAGDGRMIAVAMQARIDNPPSSTHSLLRLLPPPHRIAPLLRALP